MQEESPICIYITMMNFKGVRKRVAENLFRIVNVGKLSAGLIIKGETIGRGALFFHFVIQSTLAQMCED